MDPCRRQGTCLRKKLGRHLKQAMTESGGLSRRRSLELARDRNTGAVDKRNNEPSSGNVADSQESRPS
jgi:hypothetical protein